MPGRPGVGLAPATGCTPEWSGFGDSWRTQDSAYCRVPQCPAQPDPACSLDTWPAAICGRLRVVGEAGPEPQCSRLESGAVGLLPLLVVVGWDSWAHPSAAESQPHRGHTGTEVAAGRRGRGALPASPHVAVLTPGWWVALTAAICGAGLSLTGGSRRVPTPLFSFLHL